MVYIFWEGTFLRGEKEQKMSFEGESEIDLIEFWKKSKAMTLEMEKMGYKLFQEKVVITHKINQE